MSAQKFLIASVILSALLLLSACYRLVPPPNHVRASVVLEEGTTPRFFYWPNIISERELQRSNYYLSGVQVREADCPGRSCDRVVWEIAGDTVWSRSQRASDLIPLPESIEYGEEIPGTRIEVPAETLKPNITYSVGIGIMGLDEKYENKIHFSANARFRLSP